MTCVVGLLDKGKIYTFREAVIFKLDEIINDLTGKNIQLDLFSAIKDKKSVTPGLVKLYPGSCLGILPELKNSQYEAIITSPPYCNRYDYTRTYALEHAILGIHEHELLDLRQKMLSCTVENREKDVLKLNNEWNQAGFQHGPHPFGRSGDGLL